MMFEPASGSNMMLELASGAPEGSNMMFELPSGVPGGFEHDALILTLVRTGPSNPICFKANLGAGWDVESKLP